MSTIEIKNTGPIEQLSIPLPDDGGLVVLRGGHGEGKSTAIRAIDRVLGGKSKDLAARDGAKKGTVTLGSATLTISASRTTTRGEAEVSEISSRLDITSLVDPGIDSPASADAKRIKALIGLSGVSADPADFYELVGSKASFEKLGVDCETNDPIVLSGRVKRKLEDQARRYEKQAEQHEAKAKAAQELVGEVDIEAVSDGAELRKVHEAAVLKLARLDANRRAYLEQDQKRAEAQKKLDNMGGYDGPDPSQAAAKLDESQELLNRAIAVKDEAMENLRNAERALADAQQVHNANRLKLVAAEDHFRSIENWRDILGTSISAGPSDAEVDEAKN